MHKAALKKPDHPKQHTGDQEPTHKKLTIQTKCEAKFTSTSKEWYVWGGPKTPMGKGPSI